MRHASTAKRLAQPSKVEGFGMTAVFVQLAEGMEKK
jgi:hypothetical protein